ncbi:porin family protein [Candidatus Berkiella cookevillensis]|uniref:Porin family protein n=1 Tax=Candidatus Berkiella cookevillensis TaxID=437022 RepID=A0A0Q9YQG3_9GAMM|nr:outer membrane beta-barrel protein [Candidatus Berkiella cookevillensis]MCS5709310.1 porin family protein [Candidatus Berkiella cookevillensis]
MKVTNKFSLCLISLLMMFCVSAHANAPYVLGEVGIYGLGENNNLWKNIYDNDTKLNARLAAGYLWDVANNTKAGIETGFNLNQSNKVRYDDLTIKFKRHSFDLLGVLDFYPTQKFDVFAKVGTAYTKNKLSLHYLNLNDSVSHSTFVPKAVIGAGYDFSKDLNVNLSLSHEFKKNSDSVFSVIPSASTFMLGMKYNFVV